MTKKHSREFLDYIADVIARNPLLHSGDIEMDPWLRRSNYVWVTELADVLYEEGFLIDKVVSQIHDTNEDKRPETASSTWVGFCFDEDNHDYAFTAVWHLNMDKFLRNRECQHYYELTDLDIEPKEDYDRRFREWYERWKKTKTPAKAKEKR
jgi:hypothetical protein